MNSSSHNNLSRNIKKLIAEFDKYEMNRNDLLKECIRGKLKNTLLKYNEEINFNSDFLLQQSSYRVLKALTKIQKKDDSEALQTLANKLEENKENA